MKTSWVIYGILAMLVFVLGGSFISNYNYGNAAEKEITAQYENMENILAQYGLKVKEAAQVPNMQTKALKELFTGALDARYGGDGSKAAFQWIQEQNPNLDQSTYKELQQIVVAGRNKFENAQTRFIDAKRTYETNLGYLWKGFWLGVAGYPKIDLSKFAIISSGHAKNAFETKIDEGIQLQ